MKVHLVDGTYELFRAYYGAPSVRSPTGVEVGATRSFLRSLLGLLGQQDVTHVAVAFDTVIESFRNTMFAGYKTGDGIEPELWAQFPLVEQATAALGCVVWPMTEFEADDALATGAARWHDAPGVEQIVLCSPDKDFGQCVRGTKIVMWDRLRSRIIDEAGVVAKFGMGPASVPDWLALVGDTADGIPGVPKWGAKSAGQVLAHYTHVDAIPDDPSAWSVKIRGAAALAESLGAHRTEVTLYRALATLRTDVPLVETLDDLAWRGAHRAALAALCDVLGDVDFPKRVPRFVV